jgi:tetratricopeptide (TPR) repeat protein
MNVNRSALGSVLLMSAMVVAGIAAGQEQDEAQALWGMVKRGAWAEARDAAKRLGTRGANAAVAAYLGDVANIVLDDKATVLSEYDFPYSDKTALSGVRAWVESLMRGDPTNPNVILASALLYSPKGFPDSSKMVALLEKAKAQAPGNAFVLEALGSGYGAQGEFDQAVAALQSAIKINPKSSGAWTNLGVAYLKKGNTAEAEKALKRAIEVNANDGTAQFNLGSYYAERNMNEQARPILEKAIQCMPKLMEARWNLGGVYFKSGERQKAVEQLKEMIRIAPDSPMGSRAKQMLSRLGE